VLLTSIMLNDVWFTQEGWSAALATKTRLGAEACLYETGEGHKVSAAFTCVPTSYFRLRCPGLRHGNPGFTISRANGSF
jgi:hypothetical protein